MTTPSTTNAVGTPTPSRAQLGADTRLGPVHLTVRSLAQSVPFYENVIGLREQAGSDRDAGIAALGVGGEDVLVLHEDASALGAGRHSGLYHVALLYPSREELARAGVRVATAGVPIDGLSDHGTHEAIYLPDPDGNGLELAADRPRSEWPDFSRPDAAYAAGPRPLDQAGLFGLVSGEDPVASAAAPGLRVGHLHLYVGDLSSSLAFYRDVLGFDLIMEIGGQAAFVSAGGYHHHVAFNTWRGVGIPPMPSTTVGLGGRGYWTLVVADQAELALVRDRLEAAGVAVDCRSDGVLARDPAGMAVLVRADSQPLV
jgi:catechol 2,3-dioxygenase